MANYAIEARSFPIAFFWCHNFWVLKKGSGGASVAELHGLAYDPVRQRTLPIGTTREHRLRVFVYPHEAGYSVRLGSPIHTTRMFARSRARPVYEGADALCRWEAAIRAIPALNQLDLTYPPFGFNILTPAVNSNSAYRTFAEIMGVPVPDFRRAYVPGLRSRMMGVNEMQSLLYREIAVAGATPVDPRELGVNAE